VTTHIIATASMLLSIVAIGVSYSTYRAILLLLADEKSIDEQQ
jgi:hypothetical protein